MSINVIEASSILFTMLSIFAIKAGESSGTVNVFMYVSYSILAIAALIVLVFTVLNLVSNTSGLKNKLIGICAFAVLSLVCYFGFANGVESTLKNGDILSANGSKLIGAALYLFYFLALIAGGIMLGFGIKKILTIRKLCLPLSQH